MGQTQFRSELGRFEKGFIPKTKGINTVKCVCKHCEKEFYPKDFVKRVYCSKDCYQAGYKHWNAGTAKKYTCEVCGDKFQPKSHGKDYRFCSITCRGKYFSKENHWLWKNGITEENHKIRTSTQYLNWRMSVLQRDRFSCVNCGYRSKGKNSKDVVVDHIKPFSLFPELRLATSNGRTLCRKCDAVLGWNFNRERRIHGTVSI